MGDQVARARCAVLRCCDTLQANRAHIQWLGQFSSLSPQRRSYFSSVCQFKAAPGISIIMSRLADVQRILISKESVLQTLKALQSAGDQLCECLVLWIGQIDDSEALVFGPLVPEQRAVRSEDGVGYFVESHTLFELNKTLSESRLRLIAQVHSHPSDAYHSSTDDQYAIVTAEGGLSLVVPNFGDAPADPAEWAVYRLSSGRWRALSAREARELFRLTESI